MNSTQSRSILTTAECLNMMLNHLVRQENMRIKLSNMVIEAMMGRASLPHGLRIGSLR